MKVLAEATFTDGELTAALSDVIAEWFRDHAEGTQIGDICESIASEGAVTLRIIRPDPDELGLFANL